MSFWDITRTSSNNCQPFCRQMSNSCLNALLFLKKNGEANSKIPSVILRVFPAFGLFWCVLSHSAFFSSSFRWHILYFKSWKTTFKKVSLEQKTIILNLDCIYKTSLCLITFMSVYSGAASRISGITHSD